MGYCECTPEDTFQEFWKDLVTDENGNLDPEKIKAELHDYSTLLQEVPKVYCDITNRRFSKPNTAAVHIIECVDERIGDAYDEGWREGWREGYYAEGEDA